ncbi:MAG: ubiquinol-cytochrome c reductase iron-sulfur subunit [Halorhabdus sp.]
MSDNNSTGETDSSPDPRRRRLLNWLAGLGIVSFVIGLATPLKDLALAVKTGTAKEGKPQLPGQRLVFAHAHESETGHQHEKGMVITADKLQAPEGVLAFPEDLTKDSESLIVLNKLNPDDLQPPTKMEWTDQGFVAYSAICTHLGCTVSYTDEEHNVGSPHDHCPCHTGEFDPYQGAKVVGGPPPSPLPQIGVKVNNNNELVLTSTFEEGE